MRRGRRLVLLCLVGLLLSGCWDRIEVEDLLYLVTIGVDKGETERYRVTARAAIFAARKSGIIGGTEGGAPVADLLIAEADSISQAVFTMNSAVAQRISMRHVRSIMVGEDLAREGLRDLLSELTRNAEIRGTAGFVVARGTAQEALEMGRWTGGFNPARVAEGVLLVEKQLHMAPPTRLHHMINRASAIGVQPFAAAVAVNPRVTGAEPELAGGESAVAGDLNRLKGNPVEVAGTAVFRDNYLMGFLTVDQTQSLLALRGEMGKAYITIPNPFKPDQTLMMRFQQENLPKYQPTFTPEGPHVRVSLLFEGEVLSGDENYRYESVRTKVEESARLHIENEMRTLLGKLKEWGSDPIGFGLLFRGKFATFDDWARYNWEEQVERLEVDVSATMRIRRHGLILGGERALKE